MEEIKPFWEGLNSSDIIAISAACIALFSGGIALWQGWLMRRHNVLSVTPHIDIEKNLVAGEVVTIGVCNHGIGPAIVRELNYVKSDGSTIQLSSYEAYKDAFADIGVQLVQYTHSVRELSNNTPIGAGKDLDLVTFPDSAADYSQNRLLSKRIEAMRIEVTYECSYGKKYFVSTNT
ncbi:hypothetical protein FXE62_16610 [Vibrio cholerae]|uniref:hypothetical protein n=1 Tax=Vibrio cholerae TaxID=666 RepID=UPI0011D60E50|nr:hypothetical protein [Vibrio cholerae]TXZ02584.1 hypothetical protein FXE62_16610 [Vibrio cholerae]GHY24363.1 hypothetical protein VCSRO69_3616 [Vibrio cholerae]